MLKSIAIIGAALATAATAVPAQAQYYGGGDRYAGQRYYGDRYDRYQDGRYRDYYRDGRGYRTSRAYYGRDGYAYRCRSNGTTGTILGAIVGGLLGDAAVGRRGDGTAGAIVGGGVGALAGRAIERNGSRC